MTDRPILVAAMGAHHWPQVLAIYAAGIATGPTFETQPPSWEAFDTGKLPDQRLVAVDSKGLVLGWAAASKVSDRDVYAGVVEHSIYVDFAVQGQGVGRLLLDELVASTEAAGIWTIQSGIFPENAPSLRLHHAAGFELVGVRRGLGRMSYGPLAGRWRDVLLVERRSVTVGIR